MIDLMILICFSSEIMRLLLTQYSNKVTGHIIDWHRVEITDLSILKIQQYTKYIWIILTYKYWKICKDTGNVYGWHRGFDCTVFIFESIKKKCLVISKNYDSLYIGTVKSLSNFHIFQILLLRIWHI